MRFDLEENVSIKKTGCKCNAFPIEGTRFKLLKQIILYFDEMRLLNHISDIGFSSIPTLNYGNNFPYNYLLHNLIK